jgi:hypothetical protein
MIYVVIEAGDAADISFLSSWCGISIEEEKKQRRKEKEKKRRQGPYVRWCNMFEPKHVRWSNMLMCAGATCSAA